MISPNTGFWTMRCLVKKILISAYFLKSTFRITIRSQNGVPTSLPGCLYNYECNNIVMFEVLVFGVQNSVSNITDVTVCG